MSIRIQEPDSHFPQELQSQVEKLQRELSFQINAKVHFQQIQDLLTQTANWVQRSPQAAKTLPLLEKMLPIFREGIQNQDNGLLIDALESLKESCNIIEIRDY